MSNEFIPWSGGECPVPAGTMVICEMRDGTVFGPVPALVSQPGKADEATQPFWRDDGSYSDIVAYRVVSEPMINEGEVNRMMQSKGVVTRSEPSYEEKLRDQLAMAAMQGMTSPSMCNVNNYYDQISKESYELADRMLIARKQKGE